MKQIILSNGVIKTMTFEEVLEQFKPMMNKATNIAISKFGCSIDKEDMIQEMKFETWKAYEEYNGANAFSTFLHYKLKKVTGNTAQRITAQKRTNEGIVSMDATIGDSEKNTLQNVLSSDDFTSENMIASEMMTFIESNITEREQSELKSVLYPKEYNSTHLSKELEISRQAAHLKIKNLKTKLRQLLIQHNFAYDLSA
ncbi:sigma-70 family RNA polymerase sigma factor [Lysinibacillus sp. TE18511]